jgi:hypothetical protein
LFSGHAEDSPAETQTGEENFKMGMPDLAQLQNNCLPTSAANLLIWFGQHGFPNLLADHLTSPLDTTAIVRDVMDRTRADYYTGTPSEYICTGLAQYIHDKGYGCTITYRGPATEERFSPSWLDENKIATKGFLLLFAYVKYVPSGGYYQSSSAFGHVVTLVSATPSGSLLIRDPRHREPDHGGKLIVPKMVRDASWKDVHGNVLSEQPLWIFDGAQLEANPGSQAILTGAIRIELLNSQDSEPENAISLE